MVPRGSSAIATNTHLVRHGLLAAAGVLGMALCAAAPAADLMDIYQRALVSDPVYLAAAATDRAAQEAVPQARAGLLPDLSLSAAAGKDDQTVHKSSFGVTPAERWFETRSFTLTLRQPIYRYDRYVALGQARSQVRQADVQYAAARQDLMIRVAQAYFGVLNAQDNLRFQRSNLQAIAQQLKQAQQRYDVGLIAITDVETAKAGYDLASADVISAENALANAREALREVAGEYHSELAPLGGKVPLVMPHPDDIDQWTQTALRQNLQLEATRLASDIARQEIRRVESGHMPTLDLVGTVGRSYAGSGQTGASDVSDNTIGFELNLPIYSGGSVLSQTRQSRALYSKALQDLESSRRQTQLSAREAFLGVQSGISQVQALAQAVKSNESALAAVQAGFEVGTRTSVDVLNAQRDLTQARSNYANARYTYVVDILKLKQAAGTLSEQDLVQVNSWLKR